MSRLVMVIDDALVVRAILDTCLRRAGYEVRCFEDGLQALGWLNTTEARIPDLIFVDLGLPRLDGYEIIRLLKAKHALEDTVLVILSGRDGLLDRIKGQLVGAHTYLTKPFPTQTILEGPEDAEPPNPSLRVILQSLYGAKRKLSEHREERDSDRAAGSTVGARRSGISACFREGDGRITACTTAGGV